MTKLRLEYVHEFRDRHGRVRRYFRRDGKRTPLPGMPGSSEFMAAYQAALDGAPIAAAPAAIGNERTLPGTVNAMVVGYLGSAAFHRLAASSQKDYRRILDELRRQHGDKRIGTLERKHVIGMLNAKAQTPAAARNFLRCLRCVIGYSIDIGARDHDPTANIRLKGSTAGGYPTWSEDDITSFRAAYSVGTKQRLALELLLGTALRCSDVVRVGRGNVRDGTINGITQQKTKAPLPPIPIGADMAAAINATTHEHVVLLVNEWGRGFTAHGFSKWFVHQCKRIGLHGSPHGLRKAACRRLAEAGCSANEIAAISGHRSLSEVARYTRAVDQAKMARSAIERTEGEHRAGKPSIEVANPGKKH
jgi:site-specific recombinase XerD